MPTPEAGITTDGNLRDRTGGTAQCGQRRAIPLTSNITLPGGVQHLKKMKRLSWILTWKLCQSWDWRSTAFSRGQLKGGEDRTSSPEPPVEELESWVTWRAQMHNTHGWWQELAEVPGVDDHEKLAWEVQASFKLPQQISKQHCVENYHQTPPAPLCLHWKSFLPPPDSKFACQDISKLQWAYAQAQALQFWVEKANLPTHGQPHLLAVSIIDLREEMKCYVSFSDENVFSGMAFPEEPSITQPKEAAPKSAQPTQANSPVKEAIAKVTKEPTKKEKPLNWFLG